MSKHVEVPEAVEAIAKSRWERARRSNFLAAWDKQSEGVRGRPLAEAGDDLNAALPLIYKHFCDRLREVWTKAMADPAAFTPRRLQVDDLEAEEPLIDWQLRAVEEALQAASIPEVDRG